MRVKKNLLKYKDPNTGKYIPIPAVVGESGEVGDISSEMIAEALGYIPADEEKVNELSEEIGDLNGFFEFTMPFGKKVEFIDGYYIRATGTTDDSTAWSYIDYIEIDPESKYQISGVTSVSNAGHHAFYDKNQNFISSIATQIGLMVLEIPSNAKYIRMSCKIQDKTTFKFQVIGKIKVSDIMEEINAIKNDTEGNVDAAPYNALINSIRVKSLEEESDFMKKNLDSMLKYKNGSETSSDRIYIGGTGERKHIIHLHRRANDRGYHEGSNAYLPNAQKDFSDVRIIGSNGEYLPYHVVWRGNIDILQDTRLGIDNTCRIYKNSHGVIFNTVNDKIRQSSDNGYTWNIIDAFSEFTRPRILGITADDVLFFGKGGILYRSEYPYSSYTEVIDSREEYTETSINTYSLVIVPENGYILFGAYQLERSIRIYRSKDNGFTWETVYSDLTGKYQHVHSMIVDTNQTPTAIYAGLDLSGGGVLKSVDMGDTWVDLRVLHPEMPKSTDHGVIYCGKGYRLLGGETGIVEDYSIIKTTDDVTFRPTLTNGHGIYRIEELDGKLYGGMVGVNHFTSCGIVMSDDEGETWTQIYTNIDTNEGGASDGYKHISKFTDPVTNNEQIIFGCQHHTLPPIRLLSGDDNYFAELIVEVPDGCEYVDVVSGYLCSNQIKMKYDYDLVFEKLYDKCLLYLPMNENGRFIKDIASDVIYEGNFEFENDCCRHLGDIYPYIVNVEDSHSIKINSLKEAKITSEIDFTSLNAVTISGWLTAGQSFNVKVLELSDTEYLNMEAYTVFYGTSNAAFVTWRGYVNSLSKYLFHIIFDFGSNTIKTYLNGKLYKEKTDTTGFLDKLKIHKGEVTFLDVINCNETDLIQHFKVLGTEMDATDIYNEFYDFVQSTND